MRLALIGTRMVPDAERVRELVCELLTKHASSDLVVITGGAEGVDRIAEEEARELGVSVVVHRPCQLRHRHVFRTCYAPRNLAIAEDCDVLVRIADRRSRTWGSGWTAAAAREMGKPVEEVLI